MLLLLLLSSLAGHHLRLEPQKSWEFGFEFSFAPFEPAGDSSNDVDDDDDSDSGNDVDVDDDDDVEDGWKSFFNVFNSFENCQIIFSVSFPEFMLRHFEPNNSIFQ